MNDGQTSGKTGQLTAAVLVRHRDDVVEETFLSLAQAADSIVLLDTSGTIDPARAKIPSLGEKLRVLACPWANDMAAARNWLLEQLAEGWVLWLEPGERFSCNNEQEFRQLLADEQNRNTVFRLLVELPVEGSQEDVEQCEQIRLIPVSDLLRYSGRVAESVEPAVLANRFQVGTAPGTITVTEAAGNLFFRQRRAAEVLRLLEAQRDCGTSLPLPAMLAAGTAYAELKQPDRAREMFRQVVRRAASGTPRMLEAYYGLIEAIGQENQNLNEQLAVCVEALRTYPFDAQLLCAMGNCLQQMNRFDLAAKSFEAAFRFGQIEPTCWHLRDVKPLAATCWSVCLQLQGREEQARAVLEEALTAFPRSMRIQRRLLSLYINSQQKAEALRIVANMNLRSDVADRLRWAVRGACHAAAGEWAQALVWLQHAYKEGCRDPLCLRWLSVSLLSTGQVEEARPVLEQWIQSEPQNVEAKTYWDTLFAAPAVAAASAKREQAPEPPEEPAAGRQWRIDPAATITQVLCPQNPVISQISSADVQSMPTAGPHIAGSGLSAPGPGETSPTRAG